MCQEEEEKSVISIIVTVMVKASAVTTEQGGCCYLLLGVGGFIDEWKCSLLRSVTVGGANWKEEWLQGSQ